MNKALAGYVTERRLALVAAVYTVVVSVGSVFFIGVDFIFIAGLVLGAVIAVVKSILWGRLPFVIARGTGKLMSKAIFISTSVQLLSGIILFLAAWFHTRFFFGLAAGMVATVIGSFSFVFTKGKEGEHGA